MSEKISSGTKNPKQTNKQSKTKLETIIDLCQRGGQDNSFGADLVTAL